MNSRNYCKTVILKFTQSMRKLFNLQIVYLLNCLMMIIRGVSDVGFSIFADTDADADFAF